MTHPLNDYLMQPKRGRFRFRETLLNWVSPLPAFINKQAGCALWSGPLRHMRGLDNAFSFDRTEQGLAVMRHHGKPVLTSVPVGELIGPITRPVTLVTSGPSAMTHDWEAVRKSGRMVVGVTGGATFLRERGITPELLVLSDPNFSRTGGYHIRDAAGIPLLVEYRCAASLYTYYPDVFKARRVALIERVNKWYGVPALSQAKLRQINEASGHPFHFGKLQTRSNSIGWSDHLQSGFFPSSTVAFVALQLLVELGARDIEIIGMDLGGAQSIYTNARPSVLQEQYEPVILPSFQVMRQVLANRGVTITNVSPTCPLPAEIFNFDQMGGCTTPAAGTAT